jgi:hypothetical protein
VVPLGAPGHAALPGHAGPRITLPAWRTGRAARIAFLQFAQDGQDAQRVSLSFSSPRMDTERGVVSQGSPCDVTCLKNKKGRIVSMSFSKTRGEKQKGKRE